mmetsp:Transcript_15417/g.43697  ORF Transcript_15417/g.43697 Transcript_15417/m.43697 type:complete len:197 (-) Transcript_15417:42-632(-)
MVTGSPSRRYSLRANPDEVVRMLEQVERWPPKREGVVAAFGKVWQELDKALGSRAEAKRWAAGAPEWVNTTLVDSTAWHHHLRDYRFMICPMGRGVQSPKFMEAILMGTVPIVQRIQAFEDLRRMGYPVVIVDRWDEVEARRLPSWWAEESKKLTYARWMLISDLWFSFLTADPFPHTIKAYLDSLSQTTIPQAPQ